MEESCAESQNTETLSPAQVRRVLKEIDDWCKENSNELIDFPHQLGVIKERLKLRISSLEDK